MHDSDHGTINFDQIIIFTDGACTGNPGPGGWGAIVVYPNGRVQELGGGRESTTNNQMEMTAALRALETVKNASLRITIYTDSTYLIRGITQWIHGWRRRGWINAEGKPVANQRLWRQLDEVVQHIGPKNITWNYVRGHSGVPGNERVDDIAVAFTKGKPATLYNGSLLKYPVPVHDLPPKELLPEMKQKSDKVKAFSYLSLVDGVPARHDTWAECEAKVKGRSGAKFKKAKSADEEATILKNWGIDPNQLN